MVSARRSQHGPWQCPAFWPDSPCTGSHNTSLVESQFCTTHACSCIKTGGTRLFCCDFATNNQTIGTFLAEGIYISVVISHHVRHGKVGYDLGPAKKQNSFAENKCIRGMTC
jgi:hypothetical protein